MPPSTGKSPHASPASPGYETRDANVRGVFNFLMFLSALLAIAALLCWGLFRHFSRQNVGTASVSSFAGTGQAPPGHQLQVNPREDWLKYHEQQEQSLETYAWENRGAGIVRVPIERAMELLLQKGLPVQTGTPPDGAKKPAPQGSKKP
jgi:hypothetical protein